MTKAHFGLIGLGVMGENLVLNAEQNGFSSIVYNRTFAKTETFLRERALGKAISGAKDLREFVECSLRRQADIRIVALYIFLDVKYTQV